VQTIDERFKLENEICRVTPNSFDKLAIKVFLYQAKHNAIYRQYIKILKIDIEKVDAIEKIPFLPIQLFKSRTIQTGDWQPKAIFTSSGTTGQQTSQHYVQSTDWYDKITKIGFEHFYGNVQKYCILALLPSYLERKGSSLVHMADYFIKLSEHKESNFFLDDFELLQETLQKLIQQKTPTLLLGVSFALLDFAEQFPMDLENVIVMETGGMKGRRKEITRTELHQILKNAFNIKDIHSEYGMTELLSQGYSKGNGIFEASQTMKILIKELTDPMAVQKQGKSGLVNIIDLANIDSCAFIATEDIGRKLNDQEFEILGRLDASDIRGCNLMVQDVE
jgi:phenylacetate-coenzyme A ligase PaaK-like adenylate-forming protein